MLYLGFLCNETLQLSSPHVISYSSAHNICGPVAWRHSPLHVQQINPSRAAAIASHLAGYGHCLVNPLPSAQLSLSHCLSMYRHKYTHRLYLTCEYSPLSMWLHTTASRGSSLLFYLLWRLITPLSRTHCRTTLNSLRCERLCREWKGQEECACMCQREKWECIHLPGHGVIRQGQKLCSIHTTLVCVLMKYMLKECLPAWIRLLIPPLCSWLQQGRQGMWVWFISCRNRPIVLELCIKWEDLILISVHQIGSSGNKGVNFISTLAGIWNWVKLMEILSIKHFTSCTRVNFYASIYDGNVLILRLSKITR